MSAMPLSEGPACVAMAQLPPTALKEVAAFFQVLAEPTRLQILNRLQGQEHNVGELAEACGCSVANVSRHLSQLAQRGLVEREGRGNAVYYRIADPMVYALCDLVCGQIARRLGGISQQQAAFLASAVTDPASPT